MPLRRVWLTVTEMDGIMLCVEIGHKPNIFFVDREPHKTKWHIFYESNNQIRKIV